MEEEWKPIVGFEDEYDISSIGRVRSLDREIVFNDGRKRVFRGKIKTVNINPNGYKAVGLSRHHKTITKYIHKLVAESFIDNPNNYNVVNHIDGNKLNNCFTNLEWTTFSDNSLHSYNVLKQKKPKANGIAIPIKCYNIYTKETIFLKSIREVERTLNISKTHIRRILDTDKNTKDGWIFSKNKN